MRKTLTVLFATTTLTAAIGLPAWSAARVPHDGALPRPFAAIFEDGQTALPLVLVDGHDDDDHGHRKASRSDHDDDDDDDCDDDDDDDCGGSAGNAAPAGTVAPPQNGLFGTGAPPQVKVN
ncbi:hypothetical protein [Tropicimonas sp. IMCC34043]|uniref:hypothetical protein n=1 Tax=Tropicimonas sp. IMCC34043 TaxID=2248760 RepID=UPI000E234749|nr:hypothetical protein [Tropicimonas sp. IMCC34043]